MGSPRDIHRKALLTALVVGLVASAAGSATYAAFVAQDRNDQNLFAIGTVQLTDDDAGSAMFSLTDMRPDDPQVSRCIEVTYQGSVDAAVRLYASASGALTPYLNLTVTRGAGGSVDSCASFSADGADYIGQGAGVVYSGTLSAYPGSYASGVVDPTSGNPETWTTSEAHTYKLTVSVQNDAAAEGASATAEFIWEAGNL